MLSRTPDTTMQTPARASALPSGYFFFPAFGGNVLRLRCIRKKNRCGHQHLLQVVLSQASSSWTSLSRARPKQQTFRTGRSGAGPVPELHRSAAFCRGPWPKLLRCILLHPLSAGAQPTALARPALHMPARQGSKASSPSPLNGWHALRLSSCPGAHRGTRSGNGLSPNVRALSPPRSCPGAERGRASSKQGSRSVWE